MISGFLLAIVLCYVPPMLAHFFVNADSWRNPIFLWFPILLHCLVLGWIGGFLELWASSAFGLSLLSLILLISFQILRKNQRMDALGVVHLPLGIILLFLGALIPNPTIHGAGSWWVPMHIVMILVGFGCFALAFGQSLLFLWVRHRLKTKNLKGIGLFPSLERLDRINYYGASLGFVALSAGIASGWFWAKDLDSWSWDFGTIGSMALWIWYAISIHARLIFGRRMLWSALFSIVGFVVMSSVLFAASFLGGWHLGGI
jgi:ABC-type transport system involved in cytochrome c biogenesis permease subunit